MFIDKELEKKERMRQVERMAMEDNATISRYSAMQPQDVTYKYNSKKTLQRNYRDFEIYKAMKTDVAQSYGKFQKNVDYIKVNKERIGAMPLDSQSNSSLEIDKIILHLCENHLLDGSVEVNDMRVLTEHLMAGALYKDTNANEEICDALKNKGIKALEEVYLRELEALSKKYGRDKLINMSPLDYIKALPVIMNDFSCIDDMQKFFEIYGISDLENTNMMEMLKFYADSWKCLQDRYLLILDGKFKGDKYEEYSLKMKEAHNIAKTKKLFDKKKKRQQKKLSDFWDIRRERSDRAAKAVCDYNELVEREKKKQEEVEERVLEFKKQVEKINSHSNSGDIPENVIQNKITEIMSVVEYHMDEVTEENVIIMSDNIFRRIEELCTKVSVCSDDELINEYTNMHVEKEHLNSEINHMIYADLFVRVRQENPYDNQILPIKTKLSNINKDFPLFGKIESIMKNRIELIQKYGYTNSSELTDMHDVMEARFGVTDKYKEASKDSDMMSIYDAIKLPRFVNRFSDLSNLDFNIINKELAACRKAKEFREQQPDFYHLGLSYEEHIRAEAMCELLPYYELALELTLKYLGLESTNQDLLDNLKVEWENALKLYDWKSFRVDNSTIDAIYKADEMEIAADKMNKMLENERLWPDEFSEDVRYCIAEAHDFISDEPLEKRKKEIEAIINVIEYQDQINRAPKNVGFTNEQFDVFSIMAYKFVSLVEYLDKELEATDYADYKFFELRKDVYSAKREADFLMRFFGNEDVLNELLERCTDQEHQQMLKEIFIAVPKIAKKVNAYGDYTEALNLEYAKHNGIKSMRYNLDGALGIIDAKDMLIQARSFKMNSHAEIEKLRVEKLTEDNKRAINRQQKERRIRQGVGLEKVASDAKTFMANLKVAVDLTSLAGNVIGAPLQLFSWCMHEARTKDHGVAVYDKCQVKYDEMMQKLGDNHPMKMATLPKWQRGDARCAPELDLDELFSSPMKKRIYSIISDEANQNMLQPDSTDIMDSEFLGAVKAIKQYATVVGVVNTDTTEMEMAFLDMFLKRSANYLSSNMYSENELIRNRCRLLYGIKMDIYNNLNGTLSSTMSADELRQIDERTIGYVESTIYSKNIEESNIEDIPLFLHEPNINDVKQSSVGDCWLVSAISSVVRTNPEFIKSMFHDTGDGNVIVRLYAIEKNGQIINSDSSVLNGDNITTFPTYFKLRKQYETGWGNASDCTWVQLLEKAYALSGFNGRKEVSVKGNKLYNVVDELTYGHQGVALMHLTGKQPEYIENNYFFKLSEKAYYSPEFMASVFDGFTEEQISRLCEIIFGSIPGEKEMVKNDMQFFIDCGGMLPGDMEQKDEFVQRIRENIQKIKSGAIRSERYKDIKKQIEAIKNKGKNIPGIVMGNLNEYQLTKVLCEYFETSRNANYTPEEDLFYRKCKKAFSEHKTLSVAIPHCVDLLEAKEHNGKCYILMRDPFNIYNYEYTMNGEEVNVAEEGFVSVLSGHKENRHLAGNGQDIISHGFRGTSWLELKDIYKRVYGVYAPNF